jgi:dephospho-CoA kinase
METFGMVISNQLSDFERRDRATFIIDTNGELETTPPQVDAVLLLANNFQLHR